MADRSFDVRDGETTASPWRQLQGLIGDAARVQARWAKAVVTAAQAAGRGEVPSPGDVVKNIGSEYQRYLRDFATLNLEYVRALQQLAAASGERFTEVVEDATPPGRNLADFPMPAEPTTKKTPAKKTAVRKSTARKSTAKRATAKKSTAKRATAKKSTATSTAAKRPARARRTPPAQG